MNNIIYTILLFMSEEFSYRNKELNVVYIMGIVLMAIRIIVPILLIVVGMIDLTRSMTSNDENYRKRTINGLIIKVIAAIIIFILPSFVSLLLSIVGQNTLISTYSNCLANPSECGVELWEDPPEIIMTSSKTIIPLMPSSFIPVAQQSEEEITNSAQKALASPYIAEGTQISARKEAKPILDYIDIDAKNQELAELMANKGVYSRDAVVAAALFLAELDDNYKVPYQMGGMYHRTDTNGDDLWGLNPNWGNQTQDPNYLSGLDCRNFVNWSFKQAGLQLNRGQAYDGEGEIKKDITSGQPGDVLDSMGHIMLIVGKDENGYTVAESNGSKGVVQQYYTYDALEKSDGVWDYHVYDMSSVYDDTNSKVQNGGYVTYKGSTHIPESALPDTYTANKQDENKQSENKYVKDKDTDKSILDEKEDTENKNKSNNGLLNKFINLFKR